jgi:hypothetical protein
MLNRRICLVVALLLIGVSPAWAQNVHYNHIVLSKNAHPAVYSAAKILAKELNIPADHIITKQKVALPSAGTIVLDYGKPTSKQIHFIGRNPRTVKYDGYLIKFDSNKALIFGKRPRSLLYAAGDVNLWKNRSSGVYVRQPTFKTRDVNLGGNGETIPELVAKLGANIFFKSFSPDFLTFEKSFPKIFNSLTSKQQKKLLANKKEAEKISARIAKACHNADVSFYPFLYGNDMVRWSSILMKGIYNVYPNIKGKRVPHSWEKASMNPSLPKTWDIIDSVVSEFVKTLHGDGLLTTFWDAYGIYSQDSLSRKNGFNHFNKEIWKNVSEYAQVLNKMHKPLIVRTWSSGRAHWVTLHNNKGELEHQFVHAPGYGGFSGSRHHLWGKVIEDTPSDVTLQTKVYFSDCFPKARFNTLIGKTKKHPQIVEYQMVGQTTGRYYFPAVNVNQTKKTIKKAYRLMGENSGTSLSWGATHQVHYDLLDDIANGINLYAWRQLSWNPDADLQKIWIDWAKPIYGSKAAPYIIKALQLSEPVVDKLFSTLGFGYDTNTGFPGTIYRREVLLMYTNRTYLPQYKKYLKPTLKNVHRVIKEKNEALQDIDKMFSYLKKAKPYLKKQQYQELHTRFNWLRYEAIENKLSEVSYWRFRYLRYLYSIRSAAPKQLKKIAEAYHKVIQYKDSLFQYQDDQKFSCYGDWTLGKINKVHHIGLGNPVPLMKEIYDKSKHYTAEIVGPNPLKYISN